MNNFGLILFLTIISVFFGFGFIVWANPDWKYLDGRQWQCTDSVIEGEPFEVDGNLTVQTEVCTQWSSVEGK